LRNVSLRKGPARSAGRVLLFPDLVGSQEIGSLFLPRNTAESEEVFRSLFLPVEGEDREILGAAGRCCDAWNKWKPL
jgi:hypothetical protein